MRGKDSRLDGRARFKGITPAYAGKRPSKIKIAEMM